MKIEKILSELCYRIEAIQKLDKIYTVSNGTNNGFEKLVPEILEEIKRERKFEFTYKFFYGHHFPDLEIEVDSRNYGIELKSRKKEEWTTNGNSVFESITDEEYEEIFLLFGSLNNDGNRYSVLFKPYWQVTTGIAVTHSPRFKIDMKADISKSVFSSADEYYGLRNQTQEDKIKFLKDYLRKNTEGSKWYVTTYAESVKPIQFKALEKEVKEQVLAETFVLYPNDLIKRYPSGVFRGEYGRSTEYLLEQYFYFTTSLRDSYSAGGTYTYNNVEFPQVITRIKSLREKISEVIDNASYDFKEKAYSVWVELGITFEKTDFEHDFDRVLDRIGEIHLKEELEKANLSSLSVLYHCN